MKKNDELLNAEQNNRCIIRPAILIFIGLPTGKAESKRKLFCQQSKYKKGKSMKKANGVRLPDKYTNFDDAFRDFFSREPLEDTKWEQGVFPDQIKFEYFLTGESDWHEEDITHKVIEKNPNITTLTVRDFRMFIRPDLPLELEREEEYLREPGCATFALRTIVNGRIIWENTSLSQLLAMYKNDGEYRPFGCGCGYAECAGIPCDYFIKTVHTDEHVILYMKKYNQGTRCDALCYKFYSCRKKSLSMSCSDEAFKFQNEICEFKFDKYEFKQQIFAIISSRIAIENIHKVWETPADAQQACSEADRFCTGGYAGARLSRLFCTDCDHGKREVETSKEIRQLRQEMIMEAIQYHKEHYQPQAAEQAAKQVKE